MGYKDNPSVHMTNLYIHYEIIDLENILALNLLMNHLNVFIQLFSSFYSNMRYKKFLGGTF